MKILTAGEVSTPNPSLHCSRVNCNGKSNNWHIRAIFTRKLISLRPKSIPPIITSHYHYKPQNSFHFIKNYLNSRQVTQIYSWLFSVVFYFALKSLVGMNQASQFSNSCAESSHTASGLALLFAFTSVGGGHIAGWDTRRNLRPS